MFGTKLLGPGGRILYSIAIAASAAGALNSNIFSTSRLCVTASNRRYFPAIFGRTEYESHAEIYSSPEPTLDGVSQRLQSGSSFPTWTRNRVDEQSGLTYVIHFLSRAHSCCVGTNELVTRFYSTPCWPAPTLSSARSTSCWYL